MVKAETSRGGGRGGPGGSGQRGSGVPSRGGGGSGRGSRTGSYGNFPQMKNKSNSYYNVQSSTSSDLINEVRTLRMDQAQLCSRVDKCERDLRCNDIRVYGVPIDKSKTIRDMLCEVFVGMKISATDITDLFSSVIKYDRKKDGAIVVSLGSAADKQLVWESKKNLKDFDNPWVANRPISITHNYSSAQSVEAEKRKLFRQHLLNSGKYKQVKCVGYNKISIDGADAVKYDEL